MKMLLRLIFGFTGIAAMAVANFLVIASIPLAGVVRLSETAWGGGGRLWLVAGCLGASILVSFSQKHYRLAVLAAGIAAGLLADMAISGWQWYVENQSLLNTIGATQIVRSIRFEAGAWVGGAGSAMVLLYCLLLVWAPWGAAPPEREIVLR